MAEVKVMVKYKKKTLELHHWRERISAEMVAVIMRAETLHNANLFSFECFFMVESDRYWKINQDDLPPIFLKLLQDYHVKFSHGWIAETAPNSLLHVKDLRAED